MRFFRRIKQGQADGTLTSKLSLWVKARQRELADFLNGKTRSLSGKTLMFALVVFCAAVGAYCLYLITRAF